MISPPNGSLVPNTGSLLVQIDDADSTGISGVSLTGSGAGSFSGTTGTTGCVLWRNLPAGTYTMTAGGAATGMVDPDGVAPTGETVSVVDQATNTVNLQYDSPGSIPVTFTTRRQSDDAIVSTLPSGAVKADSLIAFNTGMTAGPKRFGTPGTFASSITASGLFPFSSPVSVYAGLCQSTTVGGAAPRQGHHHPLYVLLPRGQKHRGSDPKKVRHDAVPGRLYPSHHTLPRPSGYRGTAGHLPRSDPMPSG